MKHSSKKSLMFVLTLVALSFSALGITPALAVIGLASFASKVDFSTGFGPSTVAIGDLDGDGKADLAVTNYLDDDLSVFRNTSTSGTIDTSSFAAKVDFSTGERPTVVAIGDLDGDLKLDLAVANRVSDTLSVLRNTSTSGNIAFAAKVDFTTGMDTDPYNIAIGDLDGDGKLDLAVANYSSSTVSVFLNTSTSGNIAFAAKVDFSAGDFPYSVAIGDLDGDGKPDLAVANLGSNNVSVFRNTSTSGSISFAAKVDFGTGNIPLALAIGDLDGDLKLDLVVANSGSDNVSVFRNTSTSGVINISSFAAKVDFNTGDGPAGVAIGDLDADGKPDLAVANYGPPSPDPSADTISLFLNTSMSGMIDASSFASKVDFSVGNNPSSVAIGDLDGDSRPDLAVTNFYNSPNHSISVLRNTPIASVDTYINNNPMGSYLLGTEQRVSPRYGINGGPVKVTSTNSLPIFASQRAIFGTSFNSIVGYPADQLTTDYWFTSYDDLGMITYLVIGNPHPTLTAEVDVYIGGIKRNATPYSIAPGQRIFPRYGINGGPVYVVSTNGVDIFTSERTKYLNSFNEVMGYPGNQLTTDYWFTSYDDLGMITYLVIGNPHATLTAEVDVYIGGIKRNAIPYSIAPGQRVFPRYGINSGPVHVISTNGVDIFTSERSKFGDTFNEVMGYPGDQLTTDYWFTSYDDTSMITYLVIGNPDLTLTAEVDVYINGIKKNATPYVIAPGQRVFPRYGINSGPVHVVSTNGVDIFTSERARYLSSFNEILGLANNQLTTDYWFTSYDDVGMITNLVIAAP